MGVHSTLSVSREAAIERLRGVGWDKLSNKRLGEVLDALLYDTLYNFAVGRFGDEDNEMLETLDP